MAGVRIRFWWIVVFLFALVLIVGFPGLRWVPIADAIQDQSKKLKEAHLSADSPKEAQRPLTPSASGEAPNTSKNEQSSSSIAQPTVLTQPNQPSNKAELQKVLRLHHEFVEKREEATRLTELHYYMEARSQRAWFLTLMKKEIARLPSSDKAAIESYVNSLKYHNECKTISGILDKERILAQSLTLGHCKNFILYAPSAEFERAMYFAFLEIEPLRSYKYTMPKLPMKFRYQMEHAAHYWFIRSREGTIDAYITDLDDLDNPHVFLGSNLPRAYTDTLVAALTDSERRRMKGIVSRVKDHIGVYREIRDIAAQIQSIAGLSPMELK